MRVIGHRGAAGVAPENTLGGVARAFADGATAVEVDVRLTADGAAVIIHDETLERTAGLAVRVADLSLAQVRATVPGDLRIPTLDELWQATGGRVVLELKGAWGSGEAAAAARAVAAFLEGRDVSNTVVSSFDWTALDAFRDAGGTAATGVLTVAAVDPMSNVQGAIDGGHAVCYVPGAVATAEVIAAAHAAGKTVVPWTVNDPDRIRELAAAGADGIITDDPAAAIAALRR